MSVPLFSAQEQNCAVEPELTAAFRRVVLSGQFILGEEMKAFEEELSAYLGGVHALAISSGTDAILLALMSLGIGPGDEVICPTFTFFATAGCVARLGATPIFVDSCPNCFNTHVEDILPAITPRTKAIIPVHLYGQTIAMSDLVKRARAQNVAVVEDAAQSLGSAVEGKKAGTFGDFGAYSFYPTKNLGALGDAGLLVTPKSDLADRARILRNHGMDPKYYYRFIGGNFRLDSIQTAALRIKLRHLDDYNDRRRRNAVWYQNQLRNIPGAVVAPAACDHKQASPDVRLILPAEQSGHHHIWNQFTLRVPGEGRRDELRRFLSAKQIGSEVYYPLPLHAQECFKYLLGSPSRFPVAEMLAREVLSIPIFPELKEFQLEQVVDAIRSFFKS